MSSPTIEFHRIWMDQCAATEGIRERFGIKDALDYLIGEKLFTFLTVSERDPQFAAELPAFVDEIRCIFTSDQIRTYLDDLERTKFLAAPDPVLDIDDPYDEFDTGLWLENPVDGRGRTAPVRTRTPTSVVVADAGDQNPRGCAPLPKTHGFSETTLPFTLVLSGAEALGYSRGRCHARRHSVPKGRYPERTFSSSGFGIITVALAAAGR